MEYKHSSKAPMQWGLLHSNQSLFLQNPYRIKLLQNLN